MAHLVNFGNVVAGANILPNFVNNQYFYARWTGYIVPSVSGTYKIGLNYSDGANLFIGNIGVITDLTNTSNVANSSLAYSDSGTTQLTANVFYPIVIEWQHGAGANYQIQLIWTLPNGTTQLVPLANMTTLTNSVNSELQYAWWNGTVLMWYPSGPGTVPFGFAGVWSSTVDYIAGDEVIYNGSYWKALASNNNSAPAIGNSNWQNVGQTLVGI